MHAAAISNGLSARIFDLSVQTGLLLSWRYQVRSQLSCTFVLYSSEHLSYRWQMLLKADFAASAAAFAELVDNTPPKSH